MIEVGKYQVLSVIRSKDFGVYLGEKDHPSDTVLLPRKQVPEGLKAGGEIKVFIYRDSEDRLIATVHEPKLTVGEIGCLRVVSVGKIGAFMDCGLERDVLLPFKEQTGKVEEGREYPVYMYVDKSGRLCLTMHLYKYLRQDSPYHMGNQVHGVVYECKPEVGAFLVIDGQYSGLIPKKELIHPVKPGDSIDGRIIRVHEDGKLDVSLRQPAYLQMNEDSEKIIERMKSLGGVLPFTDKASPELIKTEFGMSKNEFKRAIGHLLKEKKIVIQEKSISLL